MDKKRKNVLICPLNWGLGHATRSVTIIKKFLYKNFNVIIAADKRPLDFLKQEFPDNENIVFSGFDVNYSKKNSMILKMFFNIPTFFFSLFKEHYILKNIIKEYDIDIVVSDNRYGLWNKNVFSIFLTHQMIVKCPKYLKFFEYIFYRLNKFNISKFNELWIPDFEDDERRLSGDLSHKYKLPKNSYFIGPLSRFTSGKKNVLKNENKKYDVLVIISGPEPQRTILQEKIISDLEKSNLKSVIVRGITETQEIIINKNIKIYDNLNTNDLLQFIHDSELIICRSGYSSIMDMVSLGKNAVFIPTPGQTEQEYLAEYLSEKRFFFCQKQNNIDIIRAIKKSKEYSGLYIENNMKLLDERIENCAF